MRSSIAAIAALLLLACAVIAQQSPIYRQAVPGYRYSFPRDNFAHRDFRTEWWYYTGNVRSPGGQSFGFQVTFFRQAVDRSQPKDSPWVVDDVYLAHAALSDLSGGRFYHAERINRAGPGIAGVEQETGRIWNGNWQTTWRGNRQELQALTENWSLRLVLDSRKPPVIHGEQGVSRKGAAPGEASHYISLTRLAASGTIMLNGQEYSVQGTAWMDHEFFTNQLAPDQSGWDWLSVQLADQTELMLYRMRRRDGSVDPYSSGTYVDREGKAQHLSLRDFTMQASGKRWTSPTTGATYPIEWRVTVPSLGLDLGVTTRLPEQEMTAGNSMLPNYWEGAVEIAGTRRESGRASGVGYLEMTGYDKPLRFGP